MSLEAVDQLRYHCAYRDTSDDALARGVSENEMCVLFGDPTPPSEQLIGQIPSSDGDCLSPPIGQGL